MKVTIIGAGNSGCAHAAKLSMNGHEVRLFKSSHSLHDENYEIIKNNGGINVNDLTSGTKYFSRINLITRDIEEALDHDTEVILVLTQSLQHRNISKIIAPHIHNGQIILFIPGNLGSLYCNKIINNNTIILGEGESTPYDARIEKPGEVTILFRNVRNAIGFVNPERNNKYIKVIDNLFNAHKYIRTNVIESAMHNPNMVVHTVGCIFSASRIEQSNGEFWMYREGFSDSIWNIIEKIDNEKNEVIKAYGGEPLLYLDACKWRNEENLSVDSKLVFKSYAYNGGPKGPNSLNTRFLNEDIPNGLCLLETLAQKVNINTPMTSSLIEIASTLNKTNYRSLAYSLSELDFK